MIFTNYSQWLTEAEKRGYTVRRSPEHRKFHQAMAGDELMGGWAGKDGFLPDVAASASTP